MPRTIGLKLVNYKLFGKEGKQELKADLPPPVCLGLYKDQILISVHMEIHYEAMEINVNSP